MFMVLPVTSMLAKAWTAALPPLGVQNKLSSTWIFWNTWWSKSLLSTRDEETLRSTSSLRLGQDHSYWPRGESYTHQCTVTICEAHIGLLMNGQFIQMPKWILVMQMLLFRFHMQKLLFLTFSLCPAFPFGSFTHFIDIYRVLFIVIPGPCHNILINKIVENYMDCLLSKGSGETTKASISG